MLDPQHTCAETMTLSKEIIWFFLSTCVLIANSQETSDIWKPLAYRNCAPNDRHMMVLRLFFSRVTRIDATELLAVHGMSTRFSASLVKLLSTNATSMVRTFTIVAPPPAESAPHIIQPVRQMFHYEAPRHHDRVRRDESSFGSIIYTDDLRSLESLICGPSHHPFNNPDGNFLILLTLRALDENWQLVAASLLLVLWEKWHIMHAILLSTCDPERKVARYDPFDFDVATGRWGSVKWTDIDTISETNFWLLTVASDWQLYPIRASMFPRFPTFLAAYEVPALYRYSYMINVLDSMSNFSGFDAVIVGNMANALNFSVRLRYNADKYGIKLNETFFNGALGDLLYDTTDIAINSRFLVDYETNDIEFLFPIFSDQFCVIAPSADKLPEWTAIFRCFNRYAWTIIVVVQILCAIVWFVLRKQMPRTRGEDVRFPLGSASFEMFKILISYPATMPRSGAEMTFVASCLMVNLVITGTFRGLLFNSLSEDAYQHEIDTLRQLDESQFPIVTNAKSVKNIFGGPEDGPLLRSLQSKLESKFIDVEPVKPDYCTIDRFTDAIIVIERKYGQGAQHPPVHIVKECPRTYHLVYIVKRGSPFRTSFNRVLSEFFEAGLFSRWYTHLEIALVAETSKVADLSVTTAQALSLKDMQTAFYVLFVGLTISLVGFIAEIKHFKKKQKNLFRRC